MVAAMWWVMTPVVRPKPTSVSNVTVPSESRRPLTRFGIAKIERGDSTASTTCPNCGFAVALIRSMIPALAERMPPATCQIVQFTGSAAYPKRRPADDPQIGGAIIIEGTSMGELSQRIIAKVSGPAWESLRGQFMQISRLLLAVSPDADSELMTSYVKFTINTVAQSPVFAALWFKSSKRLIVGLALPEDYEAQELGPSLPGTMYKGLNKYFVVERGGLVPKGLAEWAKTAYQNAFSAIPLAGLMDQLAINEKILRRAI